MQCRSHSRRLTIECLFVTACSMGQYAEQKRTEKNLIVRNGISEAETTNIKRLCSTFCIEAIQTRSLFATAELLVKATMVKVDVTVENWEILPHAKFCKNFSRGIPLFGKFLPKNVNFGDFGAVSPHFLAKRFKFGARVWTCDSLPHAKLYLKNRLRGVSPWE